MINEEQQIIDTVAVLLAAAKANDYATFDACASPGFFVHENGERLDAKGVFHLIVNAQRDGAVFEWNICDPIVHVNGNLASIAYLNRGSVTRNGEREPVTWLETATLTRTHGAWRVEFMSSMRALNAKSGAPT
jgi:hypothetical protein